MYYYGYFRSLDQSVDPKGQEYKVVILTGWDGNSNPYPYKTIHHGFFSYKIPDLDKHVELTMTDHPFVTSYNEENVHSPHKSSTANVSFLQSSFNPDFYDPTGLKCVVALLKRDNNVMDMGGYLYNSETGETLYHAFVFDGTRLVDIGYRPESIDSFCYTTEWIGFATPDILSGEYSHIEDRFTLNAQDAYSVLKYKKYRYKGDSRVFENLLRNAKDTILELVGALGTYKKIYITNTVRFSGESDTALASLNHQQWNWFDENNEPNEDAMKPVSELTVLDNILGFLGLKAIAWHDGLIITTPEAVGGGFSTYYTYTTNATRSDGIIAYNDSQRTFSQTTDSYIPLGYDITLEDFNGPSMVLSTAEVFNSSKLVVNEYPVGALLPDLSDDHNLTSMGDIQLPNGNFFRTGSTRWYWYWEHECFLPKKDNFIHGEDVDFYYYEADHMQNGWDSALVENPDVSRFLFPGNNYDLGYSPYACVLDNGGFGLGEDATLGKCYETPYKPNRVIYFSTPANGDGYRSDYGDYGSYHGGQYRFKYWQPLFHARTKPFIAKNGMYVAIKGDFTFYNSHVVSTPPLYAIPQQTDKSASSDVRNKKMSAGMGFLPMRIRVGNKYLRFNSILDPVWSSTICDCEMPVDLGGEVYSDVLAFNNPLSFKHTLRNIQDGFYVKLPFDPGVEVDQMDVEIWFSRPLGVCNWLCSCATLTNFEVDIYSQKYVESRKGDKDTSNTNTEYKAKFDDSVVNENDDRNLNVSSNSEKSPRYSMMVAGDSINGYRVVDAVTNVATAHTSLPEQGFVENIMTQHKRPYIILQDDYHRTVFPEMTPISRLRWPTNMGDRRFIPVRFEIDYEYENINMEMREIGINEETPNVSRSDTPRNFRRRGDIINSDSPLWREMIILPSSDDTHIDNFDMALQQMNQRWEASSVTPQVAGLSFQPVFEDGRMVVSIPDELEEYVKVRLLDNGHVEVTTDGEFDDDSGTPITPVRPDNPITTGGDANIEPIEPIEP